MNDLYNSLSSPATEEALIGSLLINPERFEVTSEMFTNRRLGMIYDAMLSLLADNQPVDIVTVCGWLDDHNILANIGGAAYVAALIQNTPTSVNAPAYAATIRDKYNRRAALRAVQAFVGALSDESRPLPDSIAEAVNKLTGLGIGSRDGAEQWSDIIEQVYLMAGEAAESPSDFWGMQTGFYDFDRMTGGLQPSELMLLSGEPGIGKSMFAMQLAEQLARNGNPGCVYSLEMSKTALAQRVLSARAGVKTRSMKTGRITDAEFTRLGDAVNELASLPLYLSARRWSTNQMFFDLERNIAAHGVKWFIVDYSALLSDGMDDRIDEPQRIGRVVANCKRLCMELNLAGVLIHPMNKSGFGNTTQSSLAGDAKTIYDPDVILSLTRPDPTTYPLLIRCTFGKGRNLDNNDVHFDLFRDEGLPIYRNVAKQTKPIGGVS